jgi:HPt (histidine-containing phosphotransfer) domain-containing protein
MLAITIISIFLLLVIAIIVIEIKNERAYKEKRRQKKQNSENAPKPKKLKTENITPDAKEIIPKNLVHKKEQVEKIQKELPLCNYPKFTHIRLIEMGLSDEEAKEFVQELIPQLEEQIPLIEKVLQSSDYHQMERLTHSIKGSATNLGTGGISDLLVACNTYLKTGTDSEIATTYFEHLKHYTKELKEQYS